MSELAVLYVRIAVMLVNCATNLFVFQALAQTSRAWAAMRCWFHAHHLTRFGSKHSLNWAPLLDNMMNSVLQRLWSLAGWHSSMEYDDILHTVWLGTGRDAVGSLLLEAVEHHESFLEVGDHWNERLEKIVMARSWCRQRHLGPSSLEELSGLARGGALFICVPAIALVVTVGPRSGEVAR